MNRSRFLPALAALAVMSGISAAPALTPISPEQLLCDANTVFVGRAVQEGVTGCKELMGAGQGLC